MLKQILGRDVNFVTPDDGMTGTTGPHEELGAAQRGESGIREEFPRLVETSLAIGKIDEKRPVGLSHDRFDKPICLPTHDLTEGD